MPCGTLQLQTDHQINPSCHLHSPKMRHQKVGPDHYHVFSIFEACDANPPKKIRECIQILSLCLCVALACNIHGSDGRARFSLSSVSHPLLDQRMPLRCDHMCQLWSPLAFCWLSKTLPLCRKPKQQKQIISHLTALVFTRICRPRWHMQFAQEGQKKCLTRSSQIQLAQQIDHHAVLIG